MLAESAPELLRPGDRRPRPGAGGGRAAGDRRRDAVLLRTTAVGAYDAGYVVLAERRTDHLGAASRRRASRASGCGTSARGRSCWRPARSSGRSRSRATTCPGVMLAGAGARVRRALRRRSPGRARSCSRRTTPATTRPPRSPPPGSSSRRSSTRAPGTARCADGAEHLPGAVVCAAEGERRVDRRGRSATARSPATCCSWRRLEPGVHLLSQAQGTLRWDAGARGFVPDGVPTAGRRRRGDGTYDLAACVARGRRRGRGGGRRRGSPLDGARPRAGGGARARCCGRSRRRTGRGWDDALRRPAARRDGRRRPPRRGRRPALARARQALHDDRHRERPGPHVRRADARACSAELHRRRPRRARPDRRPGRRSCRSRFAAARRPRPRRPARSRADDADPRLARRARRGVRGRRPVEAAVVLPARRRGHGRRRAARVPRRARGRRRHGRLHARQDRRPGPGRGRRSSTGSTPATSPSSSPAAASTACSARADGMVFDDGVHDAAAPRTASSSPPRPATRPRCSTGSRSGCRRSGPSCACTARR